MKQIKEIKTYEELYDSVKSYLLEEELTDISRAYAYAFEQHFGVKRKSGEDYIIHPLNVAYILTSISADKATIIAALLHDVLEDCNVEEAEIEEKFGPEVLTLVKGVTKINKLSFKSDNEAMIVNHRKIIVGLSEDVRVIIIKLADRLHNMRTLWALPEDRAKRKAKETLDLLTPIAHRLGMSEIKSELEDLSLRYYKPDVYFDIVEKLNKTKVEREALVKEMMNEVSAKLNEHQIKHEIKGRAKSVHSIYNKLNKGKKFNEIYDLLALRVYVDTIQDCYQALGIIHAKYRPMPKRFKDYIAMPKPNMYQSLHTTVFGINGNPFEIQIRTYEMDLIAEKGIASHWSYKEGSKNMQNAMEQKLQFFRSIMELTEEENKSSEFMNAVMNDVLKDSIYVYTPKGDVIELPLGSTPIDFAYRVHSKIGDTMVGAIVNDQIVPLNYQLKENDIIKINTNKNSTGPSKEWIKMAFTTHAKNKIKSFYSKIDKSESLKNGQEILNAELRKKKISINSFFEDDNVDKILNEFNFNSLNELYIAIAGNQITPKQIINFVTGANPTKEEIVLSKNIRADKNASLKNDIVIEGIDEIKVNIAGCCKPIPGDEIIGYISKGYGINIHRIHCPNVNEMEDRIIGAKWQENITKKYATDIIVRALKEKNILVDLVSKTVNTNNVIQNINTISSNEEYLYEITVLTRNSEELHKFMNDIRNISSVFEVERDIK
ncbi:MAG: bifunctional (p)ppGpp synthetase/guanosine-3',5'-bis(diphosphate) 3'-pyrophosphohydrolase [Bacilli bacterium]|nr:bifunctional (p)ppGpp synthetase/guanosine-3',5'-bis(diphosphate) 3'-pyrophosphohydrolase [Bacilli bacterium]